MTDASQAPERPPLETMQNWGGSVAACKDAARYALWLEEENRRLRAEVETLRSQADWSQYWIENR